MMSQKRDERLKRIAFGLKDDTQSVAQVKASTKAYKEGRVTTLAETAAYVRSHRPSGAAAPRAVNMGKAAIAVDAEMECA